MNTYDGRESSDTFKELLFASNLFVHRYWVRKGGIYIASSIELIRREGGLFTHIIFLPLYTFSPNYFFLRNSVRRDDDRVLYVSFLPPKKAWG